MAIIPKKISFKQPKNVVKGWGKEVQITNQVLIDGGPTAGYCGKLLVYDKAGAVSSMHFHGIKHETFYVLSGEFVFKYINQENADSFSRMLLPGDSVVIPPLNNHQVVCRVPGTIIEFSSVDYPFDNHRVAKGDSQK